MKIINFRLGIDKIKILKYNKFHLNYFTNFFVKCYNLSNNSRSFMIYY